MWTFRDIVSSVISLYKLNKRAKREYYGNLDMTATKEIKSFWKKFKPLFSNSMVNENIVLIENDRIIKDDKEIS